MAVRVDASAFGPSAVEPSVGEPADPLAPAAPPADPLAPAAPPADPPAPAAPPTDPPAPAAPPTDPPAPTAPPTDPPAPAAPAPASAPPFFAFGVELQPTVSATADSSRQHRAEVATVKFSFSRPSVILCLPGLRFSRQSFSNGARAGPAA